MALIVQSPLDEARLAHIEPHGWVQFSSMLSDDELRVLSSALEGRPDVTLGILGTRGSVTDLEFLRFFPRLTRLVVHIYELDNVEGLGYLPSNLETLDIGPTRKRLSLQPLARFSALKRLSLDGHTKLTEIVGELKSLVLLQLRSFTLPGLEMLEALPSLRLLDLFLGGTTNLGALAKVPAVEYLQLSMVRGLADVSIVASMPELRYLFLDCLKHVTELPDLSQSEKLRGVALWQMKGLTDLAPVADAPHLEQLSLQQMNHLQPSAVTPFVGHPTLREATLDVGATKAKTAAPLLDLPPVQEPQRRWRADVAADHGLDL